MWECRLECKMKVNAKINKSMYQVSSKWCFENNYRSTKVLPSLNILALVTFHLSDKLLIMSSIPLPWISNIIVYVTISCNKPPTLLLGPLVFIP